MNLRQYFERTGVQQKFFAKKANLSPVTIWKVLSGEDIKLTTAIKICNASDWKITPIDLYESIKNHMVNKTENDSNKQDHA